MNSVSHNTPITKAGTGPTQCSASLRMSHLPHPLQTASQHSQWSPSPLTVSVQTGSEDSCLQTVIPPTTIKHNSGEKVGCCVREQEYHLGTLRVKPSRACWELGDETCMVSSVRWDALVETSWRTEIPAGGQVAAVWLMADWEMSPTSREHCYLHWVTLFRWSSCSSF